MADGKITIELSVDSKGAASDISKIESQLRGLPKGEVTVSANVKDAQSVIDKVSKAAENVSGGTSVIEGEDKASGVIDKVSDKAEHVSGGTSIIEGEDKASGVIDKVSDKAEKVGGGTSVIEGEDKASSVINDVSDKASKVGGGTSTIKAEDKASSVINDVSDKAEHVGGGQAVITADNTAALTAISEVQSALEDLNSATASPTIGAGDGSGGGSDSSGGGSSIGSGIAGKIGGAAKSLVSGIFSAGMSYEDALAFASSYMPEYANADEYGRAMLDLASETGMDVSDLLGASYSALSARISYGSDSSDTGGGQLANFVGQAARIARIGGIDTNTAATVLAQMLNANGLEPTDANIQRMGNILARGQEYGVNMGVGVQAAGLSHILPLWNMSGMDMEQGYAMLEGMTAGGTPFSEAVTQMRMVMLELMDEGGSAGKAFKKAAGANFTDFLANGGTIMDAINLLNAYSGGKLNDVFSNRNAIIGAGQMLNAEKFFGTNYAAMLDTTTDSVGRQYGNVTATTSFSLGRIREQFKKYGAMLYDALAPAVHKVLGIVTGDKFQLLMTNLTNKIARFLESDAIDKLITGLVDAAGSLLDVLNGKKSWGEFFGEITGGLKEVGDTVMRWLEDGLINIANSIIDGLPEVAKTALGFSHIETRSEREAREKKEEAYRQWYEDNDQDLVHTTGKYYKVGDKWYWADNGEGDETNFGTIRKALEGENPTAQLAEFGIEALGIRETRAFRKRNDFESWYEDQLQTEQNITHAQNALDQNDIYNAASFNRMAGAAMRTQDPEALAHMWDVIEALGDLSTEGKAPEWWAKGEADYNNGVASEEGKAYAAVEAAASAAATSSEDAAAGMDDAARASIRAATGMSRLPSELSAFTSAMVSATAAANSFHLPDVRGYLHAVGLDRVPYDNYPALLHKGEMVLTAAEASAYRFGGSSGVGGGTFDPAGLAMAMAGLAVQMDGRTVGRLVEKSVSQEQGVRYNRQARKG